LASPTAAVHSAVPVPECGAPGSLAAPLRCAISKVRPAALRYTNGASRASAERVFKSHSTSSATNAARFKVKRAAAA
jgi:hypothetical protein